MSEPRRWKRATKFVMPGEMDTGESIEHYIKTLEATIAELRANLSTCQSILQGAFNVQTDLKVEIDELRAEIERQREAYEDTLENHVGMQIRLAAQEETIATQARVIEKLKEAHRKNANEDFRGNRTGESIRSFKILEEIAAIEREGEGYQ